MGVNYPYPRALLNCSVHEVGMLSPAFLFSALDWGRA